MTEERSPLELEGLRQMKGWIDEKKKTAELEKVVKDLRAENAALVVERDRLRAALAVVDEEQGCCAPGDWCYFMPYSELALAYTDAIKERDALRAENAALAGERDRSWVETFMRECKIRAGLPDDGLLPPLLDWINRARKALDVAAEEAP